MAVEENTTTEVSHKGDVRRRDVDYAMSKVRSVADTVREPVRHVEIRLVVSSDTGRARPALAEATIDIDGRIVRAHVAAATCSEAVDLLVDRLRRRVRRHEDRRHRMGERHRTDETAWHHGDQPTQRPEYLVRPRDEREVVKRKSFAWGVMSLDEAAFELDHLAHDFFLFECAETGSDAVLFHGDGNQLLLLHPRGDRIDLGSVAAPIEQSDAAIPTLVHEDALEALEAGGWRWLFHLDPESGRGRVVYHRFDGHYGLIMPS